MFLSHSSADKPFVRMVAADLISCGLAVWIDEGELGVGDLFMQRIQRAIGESVFVATFLSPHSLKSRWVADEMALAEQVEVDRQEVVILPILLPGLADSALPPGLADRIFADFRQPGDYDKSFASLLRRVNPTELPTAERWHNGLTLDATRKRRLVDAGQDASLRDWIAGYFRYRVRTDALCPDPTERYWAYVGLGELTGEASRAVLETGRTDPDQHARSGAEVALARIDISN